jgi:hypothetical protein
MTVLEFNAVEFDERGERRPFSKSYNCRRLALVGDWLWLRAHLAGSVPLLRGNVLCFGVDARQATIEGRVGVSLAGLSAQADGDVLNLLQLNLELMGEEPRSARKHALAQLAEWRLSTLADRRLASLNGAEMFAAQALFAMSTKPELIVLGAPLWLNETRGFEFDLLQRLAERCHLVFSCSAEQLDLIQFADEVATKAQLPATAGSAAPAGTAPTQGPQQRFRLRSFRPASPLIEDLLARGAEVVGSADGTEWIVGLPEGEGTALIVAAAAATGTPLAELSPLAEAT